jgi:hypothetical protein
LDALALALAVVSDVLDFTGPLVALDFAALVVSAVLLDFGVTLVVLDFAALVVSAVLECAGALVALDFAVLVASAVLLGCLLAGDDSRAGSDLGVES